MDIFWDDPHLEKQLKSFNEHLKVRCLSKVVYYTVCWGFGSHLQRQAKQEFTEYVNEQFSSKDTAQVYCLR